MSFSLIPASTSAPVGGYSSPYRMSFCAVATDDTGGELLLNCRGVEDPTVTDAVDLVDFFGTAFNSQDVAAVMKQLVETSQDGADCIIKNLDVQITAFGTSAAEGMVTWAPIVTDAAGTPVQFIKLVAPEAAGTWRIDISRRHSISF